MFVAGFVAHSSSQIQNSTFTLYHVQPTAITTAEPSWCYTSTSNCETQVTFGSFPITLSLADMTCSIDGVKLDLTGLVPKGMSDTVTATESLQVAMRIPAVATAGTKTIQCANTLRPEVGSATFLFDYLTPAPEISSMSVTKGSRSGGTVVHVEITNMEGVAAVSDVGNLQVLFQSSSGAAWYPSADPVLKWAEPATATSAAKFKLEIRTPADASDAPAEVSLLIDSSADTAQAVSHTFFFVDESVRMLRVMSTSVSASCNSTSSCKLYAEGGGTVKMWLENFPFVSTAAGVTVRYGSSNEEADIVSFDRYQDNATQNWITVVEANFATAVDAGTHEIKLYKGSATNPSAFLNAAFEARISVSSIKFADNLATQLEVELAQEISKIAGSLLLVLLSS